MLTHSFDEAKALSKLSDQWQTPDEFFDKLNRKFNFKVDACATANNKKCKKHLDDALNYAVEWGDNSSIFMNPPYSSPLPFVIRAWEQSKNNLIVSLLKVDCTTQWWAVFWNFETNAPKSGARVILLQDRIKFDPPPRSVLEKYLVFGSEKDSKLAERLLRGENTTSAFPNALTIFDRRDAS